MKSFLAESYDSAKDRRNGMLFLGTLLGFLGAVALGGMIYAIIGADTFQNCIVPVLPGVAVVLVVWIWMLVRRAWKQRHEQLHNTALSRDELAKARSKLRNSMSPPRQAKINMPDIDLKY
jgi:O-antigen/teichoic acid export membrane protein